MDTTSTAVLSSDGRDHDAPPVLPFLHMWTGLDGTTRLDASVLAGFGLQSVGGGADPQWMRPFPGEVSAVLFAALPVGWVGEWHPSPHPQWVVPLRGRWFLETGQQHRQRREGGDQGSVAVAHRGRLHAQVEHRAVQGHRGEGEDGRERRQPDEDEIPGALRCGEVGECRLEREGEQEAGEDLGAGLQDAQFLEDVGPVAVGALRGALGAAVLQVVAGVAGRGQHPRIMAGSEGRQQCRLDTSRNPC